MIPVLAVAAKNIKSAAEPPAERARTVSRARACALRIISEYQRPVAFDPDKCGGALFYAETMPFISIRFPGDFPLKFRYPVSRRGLPGIGINRETAAAGFPGPDLSPPWR